MTDPHLGLICIHSDTLVNKAPAFFVLYPFIVRAMHSIRSTSVVRMISFIFLCLNL